jgi:WD40 repeat protein
VAKRWKRSAADPGDDAPRLEVSVAGTGKADAGDGAIAVTGLSGSPSGPGASVHVTDTGPATADHGGIAITGYVGELTLVQPPVAEQRPPQAPQIPPWAVPRPDELEQVVRAVCADPGGLVGITTGLEGAGGFGKTMLAKMACADERVREYFEGRVYVVTIGRDVRGPAALTSKVVSAIRFITGHTVPYTDPGMAGDELGRLLDQHPGRRTLLVLDDVWESDQLDPFLRGGRDCMRLVTTRVPTALPDGATRVRVDQMTQDQARAVLGQDLPPLPEHLADELIRVTGRWPLLLSLANSWMRHQVRTGEGIATVAADMLALLREEGPAAVDDSHPPPDLDDPAQRRRMVRATVQASMGFQTADEQQRLAELGIFAEDEPIPVLVAARLWRATGGLSRPQSRGLCYELSNLSLLTVDSDGGGSLVLHDVIRDYLRHELGNGRITALNTALTDAIQDDLPTAEPLTASAPGPRAAWWTLAERPDSPSVDSYLADHAITHLLAAGRTEQAEAVACDLRWVEARLHQRGPAAPWSDCTRIPAESATRRARDLAQAAHLLAPTVPAHALTAILHSRLEPLPQWRDQVTARQPQITFPALRNHWTLPDLPPSALIRVLHAKDMVASILAVAPDGTWLAVADYRGSSVQILDPANGRQIAALTGHQGEVRDVAVAPDSTWLATGDNFGTVRIWDPATGRQTRTFPGTLSPAAVAPDGTWLAVADYRTGSVSIWDPATGQQIASFPCHSTSGARMAVAPDGTWLAVGGDDGIVRVWDTSTGRETGALPGDAGKVAALAIAPDGTWLAAGYDGIVRIWDTTTGRQTGALPGPSTSPMNSFYKITVAPDGTWLTVRDDGTVRFWDPVTCAQVGALTGHTGGVAAVAPDGTWLATVGGSRGDETVRIWDVATMTPIGVLTGRGVAAVVVAPDGTWLATADNDGSGKVRIWDPAAAQQSATFTVHADKVTAMAIAPDGTWLATDGDDGSVRIWDAATGQQKAALPGHMEKVTAITVGPNGTRLAAVGGSDGSVRIWDPATGQQAATFTVHTDRVTAMAIAPDGTWLATVGGWDKMVRIWDAATGQQTATLPGHMGQVTAITVAPDGTWLATTDNGGGGTARIWDLASGKATRIRPFQMRDQVKLAIAPDSTWLAIACGREGVQIWDAATGQQTATLAGYVPRLDTITIAPDGTWLSIVGDEGTVQIWDPATGTQIGTLIGHSDEVIAMAVDPDSTRLATIDDAGTIRIWDKVSSQVLTMMRTDGTPLSWRRHDGPLPCTWMPDGIGLVVVSEQGVHFYEFHPGPDA